MFAEFARTASPRAPLYHRLAAGIAADPELAGLLLQRRHRCSASRCCCSPACTTCCSPADPTSGLARFYPNLDGGTRRRRSDAGVPGLRRRPRRRAGRAAGDPQHPDERDRALRPAAAGVRHRRRRGRRRSPTSTSAPAPGSTCCSIATTTATSPGGELGGAVDRSRSTCGTRGDVAAARRRCRPIVERRGLDRAARRRPRRRRGAVAGGLRLARPDRPLRAAAGGHRRSPARPDVEVRTGDAVADTRGARARRRRRTRSSPTPGCSTTSRATERRAYVAALDACGARARPVVGVRREPGARARAAGRRPPRTSTTALVLVRWRRRSPHRRPPRPVPPARLLAALGVTRVGAAPVGTRTSSTSVDAVHCATGVDASRRRRPDVAAHRPRREAVERRAGQASADRQVAVRRAVAS